MAFFLAPLQPVKFRNDCYPCRDCGQPADPYGVHAIACQRSGSISKGHTALRDAVGDLLPKAGIAAIPQRLPASSRPAVAVVARPHRGSGVYHNNTGALFVVHFLHLHDDTNGPGSPGPSRRNTKANTHVLLYDVVYCVLSVWFTSQFCITFLSNSSLLRLCFIWMDIVTIAPLTFLGSAVSLKVSLMCFSGVFRITRLSMKGAR